MSVEASAAAIEETEMFEHRRILRAMPWVAAALPVALAYGQDDGSSNTTIHDERPTDPWLAPGPQRLSKPAIPVLRGGPFTVQVNTLNGSNILGDAANEPSMAIDPTNPNVLVIGWRQFDTIQSSFRQAGNAYSHDAGRTWVNREVFTPGTFRSDPVVSADLDGNFYYLSLTATGGFLNDVFISGDGGVTWGDPIPAFGGDKAWMVADTSGASGAGYLYQTWTFSFGCCGPDNVTRAVAAGIFEDPFRPASGSAPQWGTIATARDGTLYLCGLGPEVLRSLDAVNPDVVPTFLPRVSVDLGGVPGQTGGPNPAGLLGQVWIAVDRSGGVHDGNVYLLASVNPPGSAHPLDVYFARSLDGGETWEPPVRLNSDANGPWQWFGTLSVAPSGRIDVFWYDTRNDPNVNNPDFSEVYYTSSSDGGATWTPDAPVSAPFEHGLGYPKQNKLGDYIQSVSDDVGVSLAFAATFNGEQDVYFMRVGDFDCNGNGVGDADDIAGGDAGDADADGIPDLCSCVADLDGDLTIGLSDLATLLTHFGESDASPEEGDLNRDGLVDLSDLAILLTSFGSDCVGR